MSHPRLKICGITTVDDALLAACLGADAIGLNLHPGSKRHVLPEVAMRIAQALPPLVEPVALFVNVPMVEALKTAEPISRVIQWHGDDHPLPPDPPWRFIPAFQITDVNSLTLVTNYLDRCKAAGRLPSAILLDGHAPGQYGGTGRTAPWQILAGFEFGVPVILAGGLTPENVAEAVRIVRPYAVDVASGVESSPGRKDAEKMRQFIETAKGS